MDNTAFAQFLQESMSNTLPPQTSEARHQHTFYPRQTYSIVPFAPRLCHCTMASTGAPHSFFADEMHHHRDEQAVCEELLRMPLALAQPPAVPNFAFRPLLPTEPPAPQRLSLQIPGVLAGMVKAEEYSPISEDDWAHASIEYEASSPASAMSMADSPVTPGLESGSFMSYAERFFSHGHHVNNSVALGYARSLGYDEKPFVPPMPQSAAPPAASHCAGMGQYYGAGLHYPPAAPPQFYQPPPLPSPPHSLFSGPGVAAPNGLPPPPALGQEHFHIPDLAMSDSDEEITSPRSSNSAGARASSERGSASADGADGINKDRILVQRRREGWTYRRIKDTYKFTEAEPTLRGRHRMLTKGKEERVRRPIWARGDIDLLRRAVPHFRSTTRGKLPWKKVGDWIWEHGGSYHFGGSTCAKKWEQLGEDDDD